jgi:hypothetical protein
MIQLPFDSKSQETLAVELVLAEIQWPARNKANFEINTVVSWFVSMGFRRAVSAHKKQFLR